MTLLEFQEYVRELEPSARARFEKLFKGVYTVAATGYGSACARRLACETSSSPLILEDPPQELSLEDAETIATQWSGIADTIGGTAAVVEFATGKIVEHY